MQALPVRASTALRALLDQAGPISSATRALLIVGAHAAGYDITSLRHELAALLLRAELDTAVLDALARCLESSAIQGAVQGATQGAVQGAGTDSETGDDPFAAVGIAV